MPNADKVDLIAGLLMIAIGGYFLVGAFDYRMGTIGRMGPGYLPMVLSVITIFLGVVISLYSLGRSGTYPRVSVRAAFTVLLGIGLFGLFLETVGLVPAILATVVTSMLGDRNASLVPTLVTAASVAFFSWLVFVAILGLQMRAFRIPF